LNTLVVHYSFRSHDAVCSFLAWVWTSLFW